MSLSVMEMLRIKELDGARVLAGEEGLKRTISNVSVMEVPDIARRLHGGEVILTSAEVFHEDPSRMEALVESLDFVGASALGIRSHRLTAELPHGVLERADGLNFPIMEIPVESSFADIINPVLTRVADDQADEIRFVDRVLRSFSRLAIEGGGIRHIIYNLGALLQENVAFCDVLSGDAVTCSRSSEFDVRVEGTSIRTLLKTYFSETISIGSKIYGYILIDREAGGKRPRRWWVVLEHARTALLLAIQRDMASREIERRYRDEFVQDILLNNIRCPEEVFNRGRRFGWNLSGSALCVIVDIDNYKIRIGDPRQREKLSEIEKARLWIYRTASTLMKSSFPDVPCTTMSDFIVFLILMEEDEEMLDMKLRKVSDLIRDEVRQRTDFTVTVGIGDLREDVFQCHGSYNEARRAIEMTRPTVGGDRTVIWNELGAYTVLAPVSSTSEARRFCSVTLGRLIEYDGKKGTDLLKTLRGLCRNNWQLKATAADLSIHYNTLRYRFERICELLGSDLSGSEERLDMALALKLYFIDKNRA